MPESPIVDDREVTGRLLDALFAADRVPLRYALRRAEPGIYLLFFALGGPYEGTMTGEGALPAWIGKARRLRERTDAHIETIKTTPSLDLAAAWVLQLPMPSLEGATYLEALAISALRPAWNEASLAGFGSRRQGGVRESAGATKSPWATLHPGRAWDAHLPARDRAEVELTLRGLLHRQEMTMPAPWTPLPSR